MIQLMLKDPMLLLFVVAALGFSLGKIRVGGVSLGISAVTFSGLAIGALNPNLKLPETIYMMGLVLFLYAIGLSTGSGFFSSFRRKGLRDNLFVAAMLVVAAGITLIFQIFLHLKSTYASGLYCGAATNAPALAAALEYLRNHAPKAMSDAVLSEPVISFSIAYPFGVMGGIFAIQLMQRIWKVDYKKEEESLDEFGVSNKRLYNRIVEVTHPAATEMPVSQLFRLNAWKVVLGRMRRESQLSVVRGETTFEIGDLVNVVGSPDEIERVTEFLGQTSDERIEFDRTEIDFRRIFVSNPDLAGRKLRDLNLLEKYGAVVTRVRRGDSELVPNGDTILELGDRARVLTHRERLQEVSDYFGDSYKAVSEIDFLTFGLGLALGLLVGAIPIPLPGMSFKLGSTGGPLVVALILSALGRTGPFIWTIPYSANLTIRQFGLMLFLAGIGTRAGYAFVSTLAHGGGFGIFFAGAIVTFLTSIITLVVGYRFLKIPMSILNGMLAGMLTQPAVLGYSLEQTENDLPNIGWATVYPIATVVKIVLAQVLLTLWGAPH